MNDLLQYNGYHGTVGYSAEDNLLVGSVVGVQDSLNFHGSTLEEITQSFHDCIDEYLEVCRLLGKNPDKEYKGSFNVRIPPELHRQADLAAKKQRISLNQFMQDAISEKLYPKATTYFVSAFENFQIKEASDMPDVSGYVTI